MDKIDMYPHPDGGWVMACACGISELHKRDEKYWSLFDLRWLDNYRYRISCRSCGQSSDHAA
ncbi:hypothetical protein [Halomonas sp. YLGW01]|uniref:hypothetical protein n=1 Tax=Halomonas sp. YLGW01 TaxID=2773308 RepID=UPI0017823872|nr:hypothetical protein [Halomonas sp. YLGW01]